MTESTQKNTRLVLDCFNHPFDMERYGNHEFMSQATMTQEAFDALDETQKSLIENRPVG